MYIHDINSYNMEKLKLKISISSCLRKTKYKIADDESLPLMVMNRISRKMPEIERLFMVNGNIIFCNMVMC